MLFRAGFTACAALTLAIFQTTGQANPDEKPATNSPAWITNPLSLTDALNISLQQNGAIRAARKDLESTHGVVVQTRAIALPNLRAFGNYTSDDPALVETIPGVPASFPHQRWNTGIRLVQTVYQGGRMRSAWRAARLTQAQALLQYQTVIDNTLLTVQIAYYDVLLAAQQIVVNEASIDLLTRELQDERRRFEAGTVPRFNVLRAEVALANQRPGLIRARNAFRIAKSNLSNLLGYDLPANVWEDIPLLLTDTLQPVPYGIDLPEAIAHALENRSELRALRKQEELGQENVIAARSGYKPVLQAFAGYDWRSSQFRHDLSRDLNGWTMGGQLSWDIFDGLLTRGRIIEARALHDRTKVTLEDTGRRIELEVRTAYSSFIEAREVLESQLKVQEAAEEALRLAGAQAEAGTGTQLDVLAAETSLTQARTTQAQAMRDYAVARARLEHAIGIRLIPPPRNSTSN